MISRFHKLKNSYILNMSKTVIVITDSKENFDEWLLDKYWLFGETWNGKLDKKNQMIEIDYKPELSANEKEKLLEGKTIVPHRLCNFIDFYSKQKILLIKKRDTDNNLVDVDVEGYIKNIPCKDDNISWNTKFFYLLNH